MKNFKKFLYLVLLIVSMIIFLLGADIMTPTGTPDFEQKTGADISAFVIDAGELANRLNFGLGSMHRGGSWIWADNFSSYGATQNAYQVSPTVALDLTTTSRPGLKQSLKLTTTATIGNKSSIFRDFNGYPTRMGIEIMLRYTIAATNTNFNVYMKWNRAVSISSKDYHAILQIVKVGVNYTVQLFEDDGSVGQFVTRVNPLSWNASSTGWHFIKMVADFTTGKYGYVFIDNYKYDFSDINIGKPNSFISNGQYLTPMIEVETQSASAATVNIGDLILTKDEP